MKHRIAFYALLMTLPAAAEVHTLTLRQAVDRALNRNPDMLIAQLDQLKAEQQVNVARDPFMPRVFVGSGLAYTHGFPMTIEGQSPTVVQVRGVASFINRPQRHRLRQTREEAKVAELSTENKRDEIGLRTVELYLKAENAAKVVRNVRAQVEGLERVVSTIRPRVAEGRELPVEIKRAELDVARARQRVEIAEGDQEYAESQLASVLGFPPGDRVRAANEERTALSLPETEKAVITSALEDNLEVRRLESSLKAKGHAIDAEKSERLPRMSLVAKYGLFAKFNNFEDYFNRFQRNNAQIGISLELPLYMGPGYKATIKQAEADVERLRAELDSVRGRIVLDARKEFLEVRKAETAVKVAQMELEIAREDLSILLAKSEEGRASLREVEAARYVENEKWISFYDAHHLLELARYRLLNRTGGLLAALR